MSATLSLFDRAPMLRDADPPRRARQRRPFQQTSIENIGARHRECRSTLLVLPTGCGKTFTAAEYVREWPGQVLWIAHRTELIDQARADLQEVTKELVSTEKADQHAGGTRIVVASVQTLKGDRLHGVGMEDGRRLGGFVRRFAPTLIVCDEAHHAVSPSYRTIFEAFPGAKILGLTATPDRSDERAMGQVFESVAFVYEILDAIAEKYLVPIRAKHVVMGDIDMSGISTVAGDFNQGELDAIMGAEKPLHQIIAPNAERNGLLDLSGDRRTIAFWTSVDAAHRAAEIINRYKPDSARTVDGMTATDTRKTILRDHKAGRYQYLCNVGVLTEGYDDPAVSCVVLARPTKSRSLYAQCVGRGLRPADGKTDCLVLDFVGVSGKHRLVSALDILAGKYDDEVIEKARDNLEAQGMDGMLVADALDQAQKAIDAKRAREAAQRARLVAKNVTRRVIDRDPFAFLGIDRPDADAKYAGFAREASAAQLEALAKAGIKAPEGCTFRQASALFDGLAKRRQDGLCTLKQANVLGKHGVPNADRLTFVEAGRLMGELGPRLKAQQWRWQFPPDVVARVLGQRQPGEEG